MWPADLEFKQNLNPGLVGEALVDQLLRLVGQLLKVHNTSCTAALRSRSYDWDKNKQKDLDVGDT